MLAGLDQARMSIFIVHVAVWFLVNYCSTKQPPPACYICKVTNLVTNLVALVVEF